jgi:hypothetical protein
VTSPKSDPVFRCNQEVTAKIGQWDDCRKCPEFDDCFQFLHGEAAHHGHLPGCRWPSCFSDASGWTAFRPTVQTSPGETRTACGTAEKLLDKS